ncbi:MAG: N-formylglutamate deformylase [Sinobacteraceae bacterium]|nr:N-formylglutamate deformylase [Nevskiaceae bacterium]MCP5340033.1 N-formylglutamate deformylase [Nevskiaceae bacterium]MCP5359257.1 N-formylglutamate deformylase [Nevskiaceae bacterium]MCP5471807.1 N-formylglutamate deformylase [Nevskiaceae bacterium]
MSEVVDIQRGEAPLLLSIPHAGTGIPEDVEAQLISPWLANKDADWWVHRLYDFALNLGATVVRARLSRTVIDVNRDPSGASLYPGQATTGICPTTTFDGQPLYADGQVPTEAEVARRRRRYFEPYHDALRAELDRLQRNHACVVLYDAHSIRSRVPRLFEGELPNFNIGSNGGISCSPVLVAAIEAICARTSFTWVTNGRFRGGWITRHYGKPDRAVHAIQLELACRGYLAEPRGPLSPDCWPPRYDISVAATMRAALVEILQGCLAFADGRVT